jgi:muramoyltetrapeptide carboxypeptidase
MTNDRRSFLKQASTLALSLPLLGFNEHASDAVQETLSIIKPPALKQGDTIAVTAPAGAIFNPDAAAKFTAILNNLGFKVVHGKTLTEKYGYLAGPDKFRADELNSFFKDDNVKGIIAMRGGWGCARMLPYVDYESMKKNPKVLMGFSDITALLIAAYTKAGLVTFHGPVGYSSWNDFSVDYVKRILMQKERVMMMQPAFCKDKLCTITTGKAKGVLVGGNLAVITSLIGSSYLPDWQDKILFLEETTEEVYRIDRLLTQLKLSGILDKLSGFIFGECVKCDPEEPEKSLTLMQVFEDHIKPLGIPAFYGSMIGHIENKFTLPVGIEAEMDAASGMIKLSEAAVL